MGKTRNFIIEVSYKKTLPIKKLKQKKKEMFSVLSRRFPRNWITLPSQYSKRFLSEKKLPRPDIFDKQNKVQTDSNASSRGPVTWLNAVVTAGCLGSVIGTYLYVKKLKSDE